MADGMLTRVVSVLMVRAVTNITANVNRYCVSWTTNVKNGGTKKKSNAATLKTEARMEGPGPNRVAMATTPNR